MYLARWTDKIDSRLFRFFLIECVYIFDILYDGLLDKILWCFTVCFDLKNVGYTKYYFICGQVGQLLSHTICIFYTLSSHYALLRMQSNLSLKCYIILKRRKEYTDIFLIHVWLWNLLKVHPVTYLFIILHFFGTQAMPSTKKCKCK